MQGTSGQVSLLGEVHPLNMYKQIIHGIYSSGYGSWGVRFKRLFGKNRTRKGYNGSA